MNTNDFQESMLKGRMAETLAEELLKKSGNTVYRFGYEAILQNLTQIEKSLTGGDASDRIHAIPDFIVVDKSGKPVFLEVKFRKSGELHEKDKVRLERIKNLWDAKILFVNCSKKPYFIVTKPPYFNNDAKLISYPLEEETAWNIDHKVYQDFELLVEKYLTQALIIK